MHKLNNLYLYLSTVKGLNAVEIDTILVNFTALHKTMISLQDDYLHFKDNYTPEEWKTLFEFINTVTFDSPEYISFYRDLMMKNRTSMLDGLYSINTILTQSLIKYDKSTNKFTLSISNDDLPSVPCFEFTVDMNSLYKYSITDYSLLVAPKGSDKITPDMIDNLLHRITRPENSWVFNHFIGSTGKVQRITRNEWEVLLETMVNHFDNDSGLGYITLDEYWTPPFQADNAIIEIWYKFNRLRETASNIFNPQIQGFGCSFYNDRSSFSSRDFIFNFKHYKR